MEAAGSSQRNDPSGSGSGYRQTRSQTSVQGVRLRAGGDLQAGGMADLHASGNVELGAAREALNLDDYTQSTSKGLLSSTTSTRHVVRNSDTATTTSITGKLIAITADGSITGEGVRLSGDEGMLVHAQGRLDLHEAGDFHSESTQSTTKSALQIPCNPHEHWIPGHSRYTESPRNH